MARLVAQDTMRFAGQPVALPRRVDLPRPDEEGPPSGMEIDGRIVSGIQVAVRVMPVDRSRYLVLWSRPRDDCGRATCGTDTRRASPGEGKVRLRGLLEPADAGKEGREEIPPSGLAARRGGAAPGTRGSREGPGSALGLSPDLAARQGRSQGGTN